MTKPYYSVVETAKLLNCSKNTVYNMISIGGLKAANLYPGGTKKIIFESDLREYLEKQKENVL